MTGISSQLGNPPEGIQSSVASLTRSNNTHPRCLTACGYDPNLENCLLDWKTHGPPQGKIHTIPGCQPDGMCSRGLAHTIRVTVTLINNHSDQFLHTLLPTPIHASLLYNMLPYLCLPKVFYFNFLALFFRYLPPQLLHGVLRNQVDMQPICDS